MNNILHSKKKLAVAVVLALSSVAANAEMFELGAGDNNFTMLDPNGNRVGGTNEVVATWDGTLNTSVESAVTNMTLSSVSPFFGAPWSAHDVQVFAPGDYTFETCLVDGSKIGSTLCDGTVSSLQSMHVGEGQVGVHMLFDWNSSINIDVVNVWDMNAVWGFAPNDGTTKNVLEAGDDYPICAVVPDILPTCDQVLADAQVLFETEWMFTATDPDGNGVAGSAMVDGPFTGFNAAFNIRVQVVPVPAAVWLMASGLLGLVGVARRKKR